MRPDRDQENTESSRMQDQETVPTRSWCDKDWKPVNRDREDGLTDFKTNFPKDPIERAKFKNPVYAREMFAKWGSFYLEENAPANEKHRGIPGTTVFRVYEQREDRPERDKEVILVVPSLDLSGVSNESYDQDVAKVWRCTYIPYRNE